MQPIQYIYELFIYDDQEFIIMAYRTLLNREPDPHGMNYYLGRLRMGYGKASIIVQLANSPETRPHDNIKGLGNLIKEEQQANHWFLGIFTRRQRAERLMQKNVGDLGRVLAGITELKSAIQTLPGAIDAHAQHIRTSLANMVLQTAVGTSDHIAAMSNQILEPESIGQLTPRTQEIYSQLKKAVELQSGSAT